MCASSRPSAVRVFGKSMHALAAGWIVAVGWLLISEIRQQLLRAGASPAYDLTTAISGLVPAALLAMAGAAISRWTGPAADRALEQREWWHAFLWCAVPNALLLFTAWVMIQEGM